MMGLVVVAGSPRGFYEWYFRFAVVVYRFFEPQKVSENPHQAGPGRVHAGSGDRARRGLRGHRGARAPGARRCLRARPRRALRPRGGPAQGVGAPLPPRPGEHLCLLPGCAGRGVDVGGVRPAAVPALRGRGGGPALRRGASPPGGAGGSLAARVGATPRGQRGQGGPRGCGFRPGSHAPRRSRPLLWQRPARSLRGRETSHLADRDGADARFRVAAQQHQPPGARARRTLRDARSPAAGAGRRLPAHRPRPARRDGVHQSRGRGRTGRGGRRHRGVPCAALHAGAGLRARDDHPAAEIFLRKKP